LGADNEDLPNDEGKNDKRNLPLGAKFSLFSRSFMVKSQQERSE
jgi:hypothetical protein